MAATAEDVQQKPPTQDPDAHDALLPQEAPAASEAAVLLGLGRTMGVFDGLAAAVAVDVKIAQLVGVAVRTKLLDGEFDATTRLWDAEAVAVRGTALLEGEPVAAALLARLLEGEAVTAAEVAGLLEGEPVAAALLARLLDGEAVTATLVAGLLVGLLVALLEELTDAVVPEHSDGHRGYVKL